ncbi:MAG: carboxymuconolactone decarboxylase family protein, partial [Planctomycetales bacterium]|nr:carboxymuconolactone decarboxylase family protein [Planctomycetales bacterium]
IKGKLGMVPNMMRAIGNSPAALNAYLQFSGGLASGSLTTQQREQIALAVGEANQCEYCLAAHSALGKMAGLSADQLRDARLGMSVDPTSDALLRFARKLVKERGRVTNDDVRELRDHGFTDSELTEVVANVALNIFTNYFNHVAETDVDFPQAECLACKVA